MADEQTQQQPQQSAPQQETALEIQRAQRVPLRDMLMTLKETDPQLLKAFAADIVQREVAVALFDEDHRLARVFAMSGEFDGLKDKTPPQAVATAMTKIQLGRSWHMEPADAMKNLDFINGKPFIESEYLGAKMADAGVAWDIEWIRGLLTREGNGDNPTWKIEPGDGDDCLGIGLWMKRWDPEIKDYRPIMERVNGKEQQAVVYFTARHAAQAKIYEKGKWISLLDKFNYQSWPEDMYYSRALARAKKRYCPNILSGVMTRVEVEDTAGEEPAKKALPAPKPMEAPAEDLRPSRGARSRAGSQEIPGTRQPVTETKPPVAETKPATTETKPPVEEPKPVQEETKPPENLKSSPSPDSGNTTTPAAEETATPAAPGRDALLAEIREIGKKRGDAVFTRQLFEISSRITPETLEKMDAEHLGKALARLKDLPDAPSQAKAKLF